jgi:hypothetical protein
VRRRIPTRSIEPAAAALRAIQRDGDAGARGHHRQATRGLRGFHDPFEPMILAEAAP